jgi:CBS domain-containing membrane protein
MSEPMHLWWRGTGKVSALEAGRAALGALVGLAVTAVAGRLLIGGSHPFAAPLLAAPVGASAVLLFALPASPLAQPRAVIGGNLLSAAIGVTAAALIPWPLLAATVAVATAIGAMALLRCLHPPGGAMALIAVIGGPAVTGLGYHFVLAPVGVCSLLLVGAAAAFNRLTGHSYPHRVAALVSPHATADPVPAARAGFTTADLDAALAHYGELLDVNREDLDALFRQVELQAHQRLHAQIRCGDIMSKDVIAIHLDQSAESALHYLQQHDLRTAPVIDEKGRVVGMVRRAELMAGRKRGVATVLDPFAHKVRQSTPIQALLPLLSSGQVHEAMVVAEDQTLLGIITQTDLLAVLYRAHVVEALAADRSAA